MITCNYCSTESPGWDLTGWVKSKGEFYCSPCWEENFHCLKTEGFSIAALFVDAEGVYSSISGVQCWGLEHDARFYKGSLPVVAHPPCQRWGNFNHGGPAKPWTEVPGADGGCFAAALFAVRNYGGVIEHPKGSKAWKAFELKQPALKGGWSRADSGGGWTCCVYQSKYGHEAPKASWLYLFRVSPPWPIFRWGCDDNALNRVQEMSKKQREATPLEFAKLLVSLSLKTSWPSP